MSNGKITYEVGAQAKVVGADTYHLYPIGTTVTIIHREDDKYYVTDGVRRRWITCWELEPASIIDKILQKEHVKASA